MVVDQGLRNALLKEYEIKIENVSFVLKKDKHLVLIEVKYSDKPVVTKAFAEFILELDLRELSLV